MADFPKYVRSGNAGALYNVRTVPTRLHRLTTERKFRIPLGLDASSPLKSIRRAALDSQEEFDARITLLDSSDLSMLQDDVDGYRRDTLGAKLDFKERSCPAARGSIPHIHAHHLSG